MSEPQPPRREWTSHGMSAVEWDSLTAEQRVAHYNRNLPKGCTHKVFIGSWPADLQESYSHDPYFNTPHMEPCVRKTDKCYCQTCANKIGEGRL